MVNRPVDVEKEIPQGGWRRGIHSVVFEAETPTGKAFDITLIALILLSVFVVILESVKDVRESYGAYLYIAEWVITVLFTIEYALRVISVRRPVRYIFSFYGLIDLLAVLPTYISLFVPGTQYLLTIRILRLLRIFRILKLVEYTSEARVISTALSASRRKILVFLVAVLSIVTVVGTAIYVIEGEEHGFTDIPTSIYWAIVTLTTVGYGDLSPKTGLGKFLASVVMIMGYGIIAVPTGIVTAEIARANRPTTTQVCEECHAEGHDADAAFCKYCGTRL
jgi:voltage-gated potassium channel